MKTPKEIQKARRKKIKVLLNDFGIYLGCLGGVFVTKVIPDLTAEEPEIILPSLRQIIVAIVTALIVTWIGESRGDIPGKRAHFKRRFQIAFLLGVFWIEIVDKFL